MSNPPHSSNSEDTLPKAPNDREKTLYLKNYSLLFCAFGLFALFLQVTSMTLWITRNGIFIIFFVYILMYFIYMSFTYFVGLFGQKFSYEKHKLVLQNFDRQTEVPSVDIYLPSCGEDLDIIENTFKYVSKVRYKGKLNVYVLDDSGRSELDYLSSEYKFNYISRPNRGEWKKAGNIRHAFAKTTGDFLVIFDADFCPRPDFLEETIPYLVEDNRIAILQTPQFFNSYKGQNVIQRGFNYKQELFYRIIQSGRDTFNGAVCTGTNAVYKRKALEPFGGTALMGHSEDMHTGFNCVSAGWKIKYLPLILAKGNTPDDLASYFTQQYRWALGNLELIVSKKFWISHVPVLLKMNYVASILYYAASAIGVVVAILPVILIVLFFPDSVHWYDVALLLPGFVMSHLIQPLWSRARWTLSSIGVSRFVGWSALAAIFDMIRGKEMEWVATGDTKLANKQQRYILYRNLFIFWNLAGLVIVLGGSIVRIFSESFNYRGDSNWLTIMFFASLYCLINLSILFNKKEKTNKLINWSTSFELLKSIQLRYVASFAILLLAFSGLLYASLHYDANFVVKNSKINFELRKNSK